ncbi:G-PROTEIN-RECEP-F1-2 domain-containing protein [Aphelenchoides fujianensis]|nr:G-PROTEIN-RECEP-F1-2 domain-containing protein [Aphelenchoides fujianensis]
MQQDIFLTCDPIRYSDGNITEYVIKALGPRCASSSIVTPTIVIYGLILVLGVLGNISTCIVIVRNPSMRTPTNFYLFSLAISDLLMLVLGLPAEMWQVLDVTYPYRFGEFICKMRAFMTEFTSYASILTITCFSLERWLAICFPLRAKMFSTFDRAVKMILGAWIGAFVAAVPAFYLVVINRLKLPTEGWKEEWLGSLTFDNKTIIGTETCEMDIDAQGAQRTFILSAFFVFFFLPALLITGVYTHILLKLRITDRYLMADQQKPQRNHRKSLLRMLVAVVIMFFLCWIPYHLQRLITIYFNGTGAEPSPALATLHHVTFYLSGYFYYSNSACNPILYNISLTNKEMNSNRFTILCRQCTDHCFKTGNVSTYRHSYSRQSAAHTRSLTRTDTAGSKKKSSAECPQPSGGVRRSVLLTDEFVQY